ncbi:uncharacterized protein PB18E9.04c-like [Mizuhopecten yessoensis]|uniref:uncharacterized protein PB18E9.04c-like n=1 Tax=Mizuhopecten yessoensis TaxID=6573 RepID=UPI000B45EE7E|nr:uncharacterized protein PB18E9.04c-like [Mizuhopecten yessoensis]
MYSPFNRSTNWLSLYKSDSGRADLLEIYVDAKLTTTTTFETATSTPVTSTATQDTTTTALDTTTTPSTSTPVTSTATQDTMTTALDTTTTPSTATTVTSTTTQDTTTTALDTTTTPTTTTTVSSTTQDGTTPRYTTATTAEAIATTSGSNFSSICGNCVCQSQSQVINMTSEELHEAIFQLKKELQVDKTKTSQSIRRKISASDSRTSAQTIGTFGAVMLSFPFVFIILSDLITLIQFFNNTTKKRPNLDWS